MKTKIVLWGANAQDEKVLIAMELRVADNKVDIWTFPEKIVSEEFMNQMMQQWRNGNTVEFPDGNTHIERELMVSDSILPDDLKTDRTDLIQRAQGEWHFIVLSAKLNQVYQNDLKVFEESVGALTEHSGEMWTNLKTFWDKVQEQVRERNLFREHADLLRDGINVLFERMKALRAEADNAFAAASKEAYTQVMASIDDIENRMNNGGRLAGLFDELKTIQRTFRDQKMSRNDGQEVWNRLDTAFKAVKEKRFGGEAAANEGSASERIDRRLEGLLSAIQKMQTTIDYDKRDLEYEDRKIATTAGQLEAQIRQAKITMIQSRLQSKEEKLREMLQTKAELENKLTSQRDSERKRDERAKTDAAKEDAKKAAQEKIAADIKSRDAKPSEVTSEVAEAPSEPVADVTENEVVAEVTSSDDTPTA